MRPFTVSDEYFGPKQDCNQGQVVILKMNGWDILEKVTNDWGNSCIKTELFDCGLEKLTMNHNKPGYKSFVVKSLAVCSIADFKKPYFNLSLHIFLSRKLQ